MLLFAAMGLPPLLPLKMATDPPRFFADRLFGIPSWHAAVLLSTTHAREPNPKATPTEPFFWGLFQPGFSSQNLDFNSHYHGLSLLS